MCFVLAFIGIDEKKRSIQIIKLNNLIDRMVINGDECLEQSNISEIQTNEYFQKRKANINTISIKIQGNILTYQPKIIKYMDQLHKKYEYIRFKIREDIQNITTEYLNFLRIYIEAKKVGAYMYLENCDIHFVNSRSIFQNTNL